MLRQITSDGYILTVDMDGRATRRGISRNLIDPKFISSNQSVFAI